MLRHSGLIYRMYEEPIYFCQYQGLSMIVLD